ncbi:MAG: ATP-binding protein [Bacteroidia bacterium]|nr:ATP-binding protein [Bacteroidia bacterium]
MKWYCHTSSGVALRIQLIAFILLPVRAFSFNADEKITPDSTLQQLKREAEENYTSFKNGPAFDALVNFANLKYKLLNDSAQKALAEHTVRYSDSLIKQQDAYMKSVSEVHLLKQQNEELHAERNRLLRNAGIYILIIAGAGILILVNRKKKLKKQTMLASETADKLRFVEEYNQKADDLQKATANLRFSFASVSQVTSNMQEKAEKIRSLCVTLNMQVTEFDSVTENLSRINSSASTAVESIDHFNSFFSEQSKVKSVQNLNPLLDDMAHLALLWVQSEFPVFQCKLTKDLEKILPDMEFQPHALRIAFFHLLSNAFQSVAEKAMDSPKGYQPLVTVSSRKLPRFIQVRIRDNGRGLNLQDPYKIFEPYFTVRNKPFNAGLGLHEASVILKEMHKAEIIIESDASTGTDFLIRFPFNR